MKVQAEQLANEVMELIKTKKLPIGVSQLALTKLDWKFNEAVRSKTLD